MNELLLDEKISNLLSANITDVNKPVIASESIET